MSAATVPASACSSSSAGTPSIYHSTKLFLECATLSKATPPFVIILFYMYAPVASTKDTLNWQERLCKSLGLKGRIRIATEGINGTLAGDGIAIQSYIREMNNRSNEEHRGIFAGIEYKFSTSEQDPFPELGMFDVKELTASGNMAKSCKLLLGKEAQPAKVTPVSSPCATPGEAAVAAAAVAADASSDATAAAATDAPKRDSHLTPQEFHDAIVNFNPETDILLDTRNAYETQVGIFEHAVDPKLRAFHQLPEYLTQNMDVFKKKKKILMYCTGGIRCEKAQVYFQHRMGEGHEVYQLKGGIHKYLDEFPDGGMFRGKNFVFDGRLAMASEDKKVIGHCVHCATTCDRLSEQTLCRVCRTFVILCEKCEEMYKQKQWHNYCGEHMLLAAAKDYSPDTSAAASSVAPAAASPATAAAASSSSADAGEGAEDAGEDLADNWNPPADDPGCPEQVDSFLSRFTIAQLEKQSEEMTNILMFFKSKHQKKAHSRSRNRKANLFLQRKRLDDYLAKRRDAEGVPQPPPRIEDIKDKKLMAELKKAEAIAAKQRPPQDDAEKPLLSFVPFLNV